VRAGTAGVDARCRRLPGALEHAAAEAKALPANLQWGHIRRGEVTLGQVGRLPAAPLSGPRYRRICCGRIPSGVRHLTSAWGIPGLPWPA